jgi:hypothetical protein
VKPLVRMALPCVLLAGAPAAHGARRIPQNRCARRAVGTELIELVRSKPGELNYPWAYATTSHIAGELFKSMTGTDILNINARTLTLP